MNLPPQPPVPSSIAAPGIPPTPFTFPSSTSVQSTKTGVDLPPGMAALANKPTLSRNQFDIMKELQEQQKTTQSMQLTKQQIDINKDVLAGSIIPVTLPSGQTIYMRPSKGGLVPIDTGKKPSAREEARAAGFDALGTSTLPQELPDPKGLAEGTIATDTETNQKYTVRNGVWVPL